MSIYIKTFKGWKFLNEDDLTKKEQKQKEKEEDKKIVTYKGKEITKKKRDKKHGKEKSIYKGKEMKNKKIEKKKELAAKLRAKIPQIDFRKDSLRIKSFSSSELVLTCLILIKNNTNMKIKISDYRVPVWCNKIFIGTAVPGKNFYGEEGIVLRKGKKQTGTATVSTGGKKSSDLKKGSTVEGFDVCEIKFKVKNPAKLIKIIPGIIEKAFSDKKQKLFHLTIKPELQVDLGVVKFWIHKLGDKIKPIHAAPFNIKDWFGDIAGGAYEKIDQILKDINANTTVKSIKSELTSAGKVASKYIEKGAAAAGAYIEQGVDATKTAAKSAYSSVSKKIFG